MIGEVATVTKRVTPSTYKGLLKENSTFVVAPCDDPNCIYKKFTRMDGMHIQLTTGYGSGAGYYHHRETSGSIQSGKFEDHVNAYRKKIELVLEPNDAPTYHRKDRSSSSYYNNSHEILLGGIVFSVNSYHSKGVLVEDHGSFHVDIHGCNFPITVWKGREDTTIHFFKRIPGSNLLDSGARSRLFQFIGGKIEPVSKPEGATKVWSIVEKFYLAEKNFFSAAAVKIAVDASKRTISNVKFSTVINKLFEGVDTQEKFSKKAEEMAEVLASLETFYSYNKSSEYLEKLLDSLSEAREIKKTALKRKSTGAFNKIMDDLDFVKIDEKTHPLTHEAVHSGTIPLGTFFRKSGESYFVYNDNWDLWEKMLEKYPEEAKQVAENCSGRTTYEKDIMSYFYFVLHRLPDYLERHTGQKWTCSPRVINSSNELDPPKEGSNGVAKRRSALTPIVNNEKRHVVVPYVSMAVSGGYGTTYCYGLDYSILEKGYSFNGNVVTKDIEEKLNGRDDYGLMFYTLTGTAQGRGYPSFLIIFERLEKTTRVHFHRTHPMRSKSGDYNPVHNWTAGCYKWMIGNVNFEKIKAQQGDLAFVQIDNFPEGEVTRVDSYDSHRFERSVPFAPYTKKDNQNVLGYVKLEQDTVLQHDEHMNRIIPAGVYEIRQCRSWEANPKGVWSLRID